MSDLISRQAAIDLVKDVCDAIMSGCGSHYDEETGDEVFDDIHEVAVILRCNKELRIALKHMQSAQSEIIRCEDCMHNGSFDTDCPIEWDGKEYCNFAERKDNGE